MSIFEEFETFVNTEGVGQVQESEVPQFAISEDLEVAPSMEVQAAEIREVFLNMPELKCENWTELSIDEKVTALNKLEQQVAEIEMRNPLLVTAEDLGPTTRGAFVGTGLQMSENLLQDDSYDGYRQTLKTFLHEGRHAYQYYNVYEKQVEGNTELAESWRINLKELKYDNGQRLVFKERGFQEYLAQPIEVDARVFSETVLKELGL